MLLDDDGNKDSEETITITKTKTKTVTTITTNTTTKKITNTSTQQQYQIIDKQLYHYRLIELLVTTEDHDNKNATEGIKIDANDLLKNKKTQRN